MTIPALYEVRLGTNDSDWGTEMPHTVKLMGVTGCRFTPRVETELLQDLRGRVWPGVETQVTRISGEAEISGWASYDDIPYWFDAYFGTVASAAASDEWSRTYAQSSDWADSDPQPRSSPLVLSRRARTPTGTDCLAQRSPACGCRAEPMRQ